MTGWRAAAATAALVVAAGVGAMVGPVTHGQDFEWFSDPEQTVRILTGQSGRIGVSVRDVTDDDVKTHKLSGVSGVLIEEVDTDSPAAKAGMKAGDVVVEFDGERVRSTRQFTRLVQETPVGRQVQASVIRDGQRVPMTIAPREGSAGDFRRLNDIKIAPQILKPTPMPKFDMLLGVGGGRLGITVDELSSQLGDYFGTKDGVLVTSVTESSAAAKAGLKAGDVITSINGGVVTSAADLRRRAQRLEDGDEFTLAIVRDKKPMTLKGKVEAAPARRWVTRTII